MTASASLTWNFPLCPQLSDQVDWMELEKLAWISAMKGCRQDAEYHAEGDVFTHTQMVCQSLISLPRWCNLQPTERAVLFAAALLHDVAKPATTSIGEDGHISSPKHTRLGGPMARQILWRNNEFSQPPFALREQIVGLVRYSGLPLWFLEKEDPVRAVVRASHAVRLDWLSILAEADVNGRHCDDKPQLLERVHLFAEFAKEHDCFDKSKMFPSNHSRFSYFYSERRDLERDVFDDTRLQVTLMSGLPGAGKSTYIERNFLELPIVSLDEYRRRLDVEPDEDQGAVVMAAKEEARLYLRAGQPFVWNATNVSRRLRRNLVNWMRSYNPRFSIVYVEPESFEALTVQNASRKSPVPPAVLAKLGNLLEVPDWTEAHELVLPGI